MKKLFLATLLTTSIILSACSSGASEAPTQPVSVSQKSDNAKSEAKNDEKETSADDTTAEETTAEAPSDEVTLEEKEIYNQDNIIVTATGLKMDGFWGPEITLLVENNSDKNLTIQPRNSSVNGYMIDLQMSCDVAAGKKANDGMDISNSDLEKCGIDTIADIEFSLHIFESDSWESYVDTELIKLTTSVSDGYQQVYDDSGEVLYDNNGIKIISKGLLTDDSIFGPQFITYIENNSDKDITVQVRDTSVNGFMIDPSMSAEVASGKKRISAMSFLSSQLEENKITEFEDIETSFHIFYTDGWDTIEDTTPIIISFK